LREGDGEKMGELKGGASNAKVLSEEGWGVHFSGKCRLGGGPTWPNGGQAEGEGIGNSSTVGRLKKGRKKGTNTNRNAGSLPHLSKKRGILSEGRPNPEGQQGALVGKLTLLLQK